MSTPQTDFSDEVLMAFADGVLDEPQFSAVADAVEADVTLAARLDALVQGGEAAKAGYDTLLGPVPRALEAVVRKQIAQSERRQVWRGWLAPFRLAPLGAMAVAACAAVVALPAGYFLAPQQGDALSGSALATALDVLASGESQQLRTGLDVTAVATFTDANGIVCREFETSGSANFVAVACRTDEGWQTQLALANSGGGDVYRPASGLEMLDVYLSDIGAGAPLLDAEERAALAR